MLDARLDFGDDDNNWPSLMNVLQDTLPGTKVELTFQRGKEEQTATMTTTEPVVHINDQQEC